KTLPGRLNPYTFTLIELEQKVHHAASRPHRDTTLADAHRLQFTIRHMQADSIHLVLATLESKVAFGIRCLGIHNLSLATIGMETDHFYLSSRDGLVIRIAYVALNARERRNSYVLLAL